ncbi:MAG: low-specificity L-threonine aldolase [Anaerolineales bacterium]|nr:MAG: low-specificity L-threonine aldolase [Anaerolineales bacterium]
MDVLDFRSDTVTKPTPEMREAMARAEVGDDVYGEDPTVNKLQEKAAGMMGMEAGLFVPSGTMGNLAAILAHCNRGDEVILGNMAHTFLFEAGGMAALGGVHPHTIPNQPDGRLVLEDICKAVRKENSHFPITRLVIIENTHNRCGGASLSAEYTQRVADFAHEQGLKFHIDGARIFNAATDQGIDVAELSTPADSITFCLSKGLAGPVGAVLCGAREFIRSAHRARKQLGGGMRQAGILAAAGIVALDQMTDRLGEDHRRAEELWKGLSKIPGDPLELEPQYTNMVYFKLADDLPITVEEFLNGLRKGGLLVGNVRERRFRMVTHCWIDDQAVSQAVKIIGEAVKESP